MKYLKSILFIFLCSITTNLYAQTVNETIENQFTEYSQLVIDKEFNKALNYAPEEIFEVIPREQMVKMMEMVLNSSDFEYKATLPKVLSISDIIKIEEVNYVKIKTSSEVQMKFLELEEDEDREMKIPLYKLSFEKKFGVGNVKYNEESHFFEINATKNAIAKSHDLKEWKFVIVENDNQKLILERFIPKQLFE